MIALSTLPLYYLLVVGVFLAIESAGCKLGDGALRP
jgi:hypothetical protein